MSRNIDTYTANKRLYCSYCKQYVDWHNELKNLPKHIEYYLLSEDVLSHMQSSVLEEIRKLTIRGNNIVAKNPKIRKKTYDQNQKKINLILLFESLRYHNTHWACKQCVNKNKGQYANPLLQRYSTSNLPHLVYFNEEKMCECGNGYLFSIAQKITLYEKLKLSSEVIRNKCLRCKKRSENQKKLNLFIIEMRKNNNIYDPEYLVKLASLYYKAEYYVKSEIQLRRAKNILKNEDKLQDFFVITNKWFPEAIDYFKKLCCKI